MAAGAANGVESGHPVGSLRLEHTRVVHLQIRSRTMFNISHVRERHNVILVAEYLQLHDIPLDTESSKGAWLRTEFHEKPNIINFKKPTLFEFENEWYDWTSNHAVCWWSQKLMYR